MAIKDCFIPSHFHLLEIKNRNGIEDPFVNAFIKIVKDFFSSRESDFDKDNKNYKCYYVTTDDCQVNTLHVIDKKSRMTPNDYIYYFKNWSDANELYCRLKALIDQYSNEGKIPSGYAKAKWCTRYMADSSGCDGRGFSHGFEALLDFQLSWNCRYAFIEEYGSKTPSILKQQCIHILNVLVNPDSCIYYPTGIVCNNTVCC